VRTFMHMSFMLHKKPKVVLSVIITLILHIIIRNKI